MESKVTRFMTRLVVTFSLALVLGLAGCAAEVGEAAGDPYKAGQAEAAAEKSTGSAAAAAKDPVAMAVELARKIEADPDRAAEILEEAGITQDALDELMYKIAADPEMRKAYNDAMNR